MIERPKESIENLGVRQLLRSITIKQLWAVLGAFAVIVIAAFSFGQYIHKNMLVNTEAELHKLRQEQQTQMSRLQFFERAFEYYRTLEIWHKSIGHTPPAGWSNQYSCNSEAISLIITLEALRNTIDRLRDYNDKSGIGIMDPRGVQLSKAGGEIQVRFSASGDTWSVPDHFHTLNPDSSYRPGPCDR